MSVVSVRARSFILALFIRDDGERFLLGDRGFDFKDSQLHFSANTIENDEVEKQGVDGVMLAGQVRRASVQSFDGYVGDGSTLKEEVEQMRRDFIAFFAKGHHFRVIYIDCNRNAWQRKGGYLVDAPEVKELWQIHPEYHVGLNFEDVNYYEYDENAEGEEILSNIISVHISSDVEGGLVWDENGAVSEPEEIEYDTETATASGTNISIADAVEAPLADFKLKGETSQNGTPTPSAPVAVQTVTGENVVKISDGQNEQSYEVNLGKNLFNIQNATGTRGNNTVVASSQTITLNSNTSGTETAFYLNDVSKISQYLASSYSTARDYKITGLGGSYTLCITLANIPSGVGSLVWDVFTNKRTLQYSRSDIADGKITKTITLSSDEYIKSVQFYTSATSVFSDFTMTVQIELGSQATSYAAYFEPIELCKIGDYQDYIYKSGDKWYIHKETGTKQLSNVSSFIINNGCFQTGFKYPSDKASQTLSLSSHFVFNPVQASITSNLANGEFGWNTTGYLTMKNTALTSTAEWETWLSANNPAVYYALATPTDTEITNEALVAQLEAILDGGTSAGTNNITTIISAGNAQGELEITYYTKYDAKVVGGYVWEAGGSGGPTIVTNESISAVSPVWTVFGPALNPMLENTTTGEQIQYVGMISEGQTLVVDMGEQTASLDGLNVISNIVGEYLTLAPGSNTLLFSADSDAPASEIGWSEIVG